MAEQRILYKCPLCGKASDAAKYVDGVASAWPLETLICEFVGGGRLGRPKDANGKLIPREGSEKTRRSLPGKGFAWSRRGMRLEELRALAECATEAVSRLWKIIEACDGIIAGDSFEDVDPKIVATVHSILCEA